MTQKKSNGAFIEGLLLGSAIGTIVGVLFSPHKGEKNRQIIKKSVETLPEMAEDLGINFKLQTGRFSQRTKKTWEKTIDRFQNAIAAGIEASRKEGMKDER